MKKYLLVLIPALFLIACGAEEQSGSEPSTSPPTENTTTTAETKVSLSDYFMPNGSIAKFKGEGNEYATYTLTTKHLYDNYVLTYEDNGGTVVERIYYIQADKVSLIAQNGEAYDAKEPSLAELESMQEIEVYLATPLEEGREFNGWKIISTNESLKTDVQPFDDVILIEKTDEQGAITRKYFAKDFGEIKREFIMQEGDEAFTVTSTLENVL
ncbi:hypothetical protein [Psychrobacillus sp. NPDC096389]|uniref:hypothetical protein n=1 Tax=Psychrobacillus sp. NPDC096389 TaxID=3364490 RepID=UPI0037F33758